MLKFIAVIEVIIFVGFIAAVIVGVIVWVIADIKEKQRKKEEEQRRKEEEQRKREEKQREREEQQRKIEQYQKSDYFQKWAREFAYEFIDMIQKDPHIRDLHCQEVDISCHRQGTIREIGGFNFYKENVEQLSEEQFKIFMKGLLADAEEIVRREYVSKHPVNINGDKYHIESKCNYYVGKCYISFKYTAPNPNYQAPRDFI